MRITIYHINFDGQQTYRFGCMVLGISVDFFLGLSESVSPGTQQRTVNIRETKW